MTRRTSTTGDLPAVPAAVPSEPDDRGPVAREDREDRRLLRDARDGDGGAVASLYDRHAGALYAFACGVLGEGTAAEDAVVDVVVDSCGPDPTDVPGDRSVRHGLAVATYHRCAADHPLTAASRSRAVLALCLHGDHTFRDAAALTGVTGTSFARLLRAEVTRNGFPRSA